MADVKIMNYRNRKLLDTARDMPCMHCGIEDGTIVPAHGNGSQYGKGMGIKAHDVFFAGLCMRCHARYDHGNDMSRTEKQEFFAKAMHKTWLWLWINGKVKVV